MRARGDYFSRLLFLYVLPVILGGITLFIALQGPLPPIIPIFTMTIGIAGILVTFFLIYDIEKRNIRVRGFTSDDLHRLAALFTADIIVSVIYALHPSLNLVTGNAVLLAISVPQLIYPLFTLG